MLHNRRKLKHSSRHRIQGTAHQQCNATLIGLPTVNTYSTDRIVKQTTSTGETWKMAYKRSGNNWGQTPVNFSRYQYRSCLRLYLLSLWAFERSNVTAQLPRWSWRTPDRSPGQARSAIHEPEPMHRPQGSWIPGRARDDEYANMR